MVAEPGSSEANFGAVVEMGGGFNKSWAFT